jgi:LacI family transcriptional regulator
MRPDAIFAGNDLVALGALQSLTAAGLTVPGEIKIIGYDDADLATQIGSPLSTIRQPAALLGASAVRLVVAGCSPSDRESANSHLILRPELVARSTT